MRAAMRRLRSRAPSFSSLRRKWAWWSRELPDAPLQNDVRTAPCVERVMGIEPTSSAWKAEVLPLNYTRWILCRFHPPTLNRIPPDPCTLVEGVGFEPTKAEPPDLQSGPFDRSGTPPQRKRRIVLDGSGSVKQTARFPSGAAGNGQKARHEPASIGCRPTPSRGPAARATGATHGSNGPGPPRRAEPGHRPGKPRVREPRASPGGAETAPRARLPGFPARASSRNATARSAAGTSGSTPPSRRTGARRGCPGRRRG